MSGAEPHTDVTTQRQRKNAAGQPIFAVQVAITTLDGTASVESVRVAGTAPRVQVGQPVELVGLVARPWAIGDRTGLVFNATDVRPARPVPPNAPAGQPGK